MSCIVDRHDNELVQQGSMLTEYRIQTHANRHFPTLVRVTLCGYLLLEQFLLVLSLLLEQFPFILSLLLKQFPLVLSLLLELLLHHVTPANIYNHLCQSNTHMVVTIIQIGTLLGQIIDQVCDGKQTR